MIASYPGGTVQWGDRHLFLKHHGQLHCHVPGERLRVWVQPRGTLQRPCSTSELEAPLRVVVGQRSLWRCRGGSVFCSTSLAQRLLFLKVWIQTPNQITWWLLVGGRQCGIWLSHRPCDCPLVHFAILGNYSWHPEKQHLNGFADV